MSKIELELSCNTQLSCVKCGSQDFRICMECNEETDEISTTAANNVECSACHALYQVNLVRVADIPAAQFRLAERVKKLEAAITRYLAGDYSCNGGAEFIFNEAMADPDNYEPPDPPGWEGGFAENH